MSPKPILCLLIAIFGTAPILAQAPPAFGDLSGEVVWAIDKIPIPLVYTEPADRVKECQPNGPIVMEQKVNPKNRGVRWAMVWLKDFEKEDAPLPIHPDLQKPKEASVLLQIVGCQLEPPVFGIRKGQTLTIQNLSKMTHILTVYHKFNDKNKKITLTALEQTVVDPWDSQKRFGMIDSDTGRWMLSTPWTFDHPYFATTDENGKFTIPKAPAGYYRIVAWTQETGFFNNGKEGTVIHIINDGSTKVKLEVKSK